MIKKYLNILDSKIFEFVLVPVFKKKLSFNVSQSQDFETIILDKKIKSPIGLFFCPFEKNISIKNIKNIGFSSCEISNITSSMIKHVNESTDKNTKEINKRKKHFFNEELLLEYLQKENKIVFDDFIIGLNFIFSEKNHEEKNLLIKFINKLSENKMINYVSFNIKTLKNNDYLNKNDIREIFQNLEKIKFIFFKIPRDYSDYNICKKVELLLNLGLKGIIIEEENNISNFAKNMHDSFFSNKDHTKNFLIYSNKYISTLRENFGYDFIIINNISEKNINKNLLISDIYFKTLYGSNLIQIRSDFLFKIPFLTKGILTKI